MDHTGDTRTATVTLSDDVRHHIARAFVSEQGRPSGKLRSFVLVQHRNTEGTPTFAVAVAELMPTSEHPGTMDIRGVREYVVDAPAVDTLAPFAEQVSAVLPFVRHSVVVSRY